MVLDDKLGGQQEQKGEAANSVRDAATKLFEYLKSFFATRWGMATLLLMLFGIGNAIIDPFGFSEGRSVELGDVAERWSNGVAKYGIIPLYPPSEEMRVGDVYLQAIDDGLPEEVKSAKLIKPLFQRRLLIGHIQLPLDAPAARQGLEFVATTNCTLATDGSEKCPALNSIEYVGKPNTTPLTSEPQGRQSAQIVGFPSLIEEDAGEAMFDLSGLGLPKFGTKRGRKMRVTPLKVATLSADNATALNGLIQWCSSDARGKVLCKGSMARKLLASNLGGTVFLPAKSDEKKKTPVPPADVATLKSDDTPKAPNCAVKLMIYVVTRVYLSREIRAAWEDAEQENYDQNQPEAAAQKGSLKIAASSNQNMFFNERFDRPIVFGYESMRMTLGETNSIGGVDASCALSP